jgi:hypothetical protein
MGMANRSVAWFRNLAAASAVLSLLMVGAMTALQSVFLPLWLHIPLTALVLALMAGGAALAGVACLEYRTRSAGDGQQA